MPQKSKLKEKTMFRSAIENALKTARLLVYQGKALNVPTVP